MMALLAGLVAEFPWGMNSELNFIRALFGKVLYLFISGQFLWAQFYGDPPDKTHPWAVHDNNRPQPPRIEPGEILGSPPSDAIILFDGTKESFKANWKHEKYKRKKDWKVINGALISVKGAGDLLSKATFADCQLHIEWAAPSKIIGSGQGRGNSGIFLMGITEVQVLDNYKNPTYPDGFAGSVYGIMPPMVNALKPSGQWQTYDIIFRRPVHRDGKGLDEGYLTVFLNGVVIQDGTPLEGGGVHKDRSRSRSFPVKGPLKLQDHGNPVQFRNIWYRELRQRSVEGGTDGELSYEGTTTKREEIAASIRKDATTKKGKEKLLRLMESLCYEEDAVAITDAEKLRSEFIDQVKINPDGYKEDIIQVNNAIKYLIKHQRMQSDHPHNEILEKIIKNNGWKVQGN